MSNFQRALEVILKEEGGYVNDPDDPGGATNFGITQATYDLYIGLSGEDKPVEEIKASEVSDIYWHNYWLAGSCDKIESYPIALLHFDGCVNIGVKRAGKLLQRALVAHDVDIAIDGVVGPKTIGATNYFASGAFMIPWYELLFLQLWSRRIAYYRKISDKNKKLRKFLRNWIVRMENIKEAAGL